MTEVIFEARKPNETDTHYAHRLAQYLKEVDKAEESLLMSREKLAEAIKGEHG